jgi:murein DD-endopeptidase MepM/ murein hydrolase activator NlpD
MSKSSALNLTRLAARLAATGALGAWLAGCSSDATRLSEGFNNPFSNPFATASNDQPSASTAGSGGYAAAARPAPVAVSALSSPAASPTRPTSSQPISGFGSNWSVAGGSPIVVAQGETLDSISQRYGVPQSALLQANGFTAASQVHPGTRLVVPVYNADSGKARVADRKSRVADAEDTSAKSKHEKRAKDAGKTKVAKDAKDAKEAKDAKDAKAKVERGADASSGQKKAHDKVAEADKDAAKDAAAKDKHDGKAVADSKSAKAAKPEESVVAKGESASAKKPASDRTPTGSVGSEEASSNVAPITGAQADAAGVTPEFRWPARGRIIEGFTSGGNDGINIAVPEGTSVKAAESGVVAYAGSELKGYGNLVLIRHPNGYVTAYANNKELEVKRGDSVKRGQIIAKSGQSGNVSSPQLHFELRKGSTPVDPTSYLAGL